MRRAGRRVGLRRGLLAAALAALALLPGAAAAPGDLDLSFGTGGVVTTDFLTAAFDSALDVAVQPDGKILVVGTTAGPFALQTELAVVRYAASGALDPTFDGDGKFTLPVGASLGAQLELQPDGKIVAAAGGSVVRLHANGTLDTTFAGDGVATFGPGDAVTVALDGSARIIVGGLGGLVARYTVSGAADTTFDGDGLAAVPLGSVTRIDEIAVTSSDQLLVEGTSIPFGTFEFDIAVARLTVGGALDTSFGSGGVAKVDFGATGNDGGGGVALQPDGKVIVVGRAGGNFAVARFDAAGVLDSAFDVDGKATIDFGGADGAHAITLQPDGKLVLAGPAAGDFGLARMTSAGSLDTTFDADGKLTTSFLVSDGANAVTLQADGKILAAGSAAAAGFSPADFAVARYTSTGALDATFDSDGKVTAGFPASSADAASGLAAQADGKVLVVGRTTGSSGSDVAVGRYTTAGAPDAAFGTAGRVTIDVNVSDSALAVALQTDGKIVLAGVTHAAGSNPDFLLLRLQPDGSLDPTFGTGGVVTTNVGNHDRASAVAIQPDGKIVVAGSTAPSNRDFIVLRYTAGGFLDAGFGTGGKVITDVFGTNSDDHANALALQTDGKIVIAGDAGLQGAVARYTAAGALDPSFDGDGIATLGASSSLAGVALQPDDKIVAAGSQGGDFLVVRYTAVGALDTTFDTDGRASVDFGAEEFARALALRPNGSIVVAGDAFPSDFSSSDVAVAQLTSAGSLDASFSADGKVTTNVDTSDFAAAVVATAQHIVVAGLTFSETRSTAADFLLIRYEAETDTAFVVNSTGDGSDTSLIDNICRDATSNCTLRAAIEQANVKPGADVIKFALGSGHQRIRPNSQLPVVTDPVTIDGTTQPGYLGEPLIHLIGTNAGNANGLEVHALGATIRALGIHGFQRNGITLAVNGGNVIELNHIGPETTPDPCIPVAICNVGGNGQDGVFIVSTSDHKIIGNLISGNGRNGVHVNGASATGNEVKGNLIGTSPLGSSDSGNAWYGVNVTGAPNNQIGGTGIGEGNVISGNNLGGVLIGGVSASGNKVEGNLIGTDSTGSFAVGNGGDGVVIAAAPNNTIGGLATGGLLGTALGARNVISGNTDSGIEITGSAATGNQVLRNFVGTDKLGSADLGNGFAGIVLLGAGSTTIQRNVVFGNASAGVLLGPTALANAIRQNSIFGNDGLGIDLAPIGITFNDVLDADSGANGLQNFPVLYGAASSASGTAVSGYVESLPNATYTVELFVSAACDPSGAGEGETFRHTFSITTDATGTKAFAETFTPAAPAGSRVTATATDSAGNTSEFSTCVEATGVVGTTSALTAAVQELDVSPRRALESKVDAIAGAPNAAAACGQIGAFENQVDALRRKQLTDAEADLLDAYAGLLAFGFGCP